MLKIFSPNFENGEEIPIKFTCKGENINPELVIENIPEGTQELVLIMDDPDAPKGTFTHWIVWNINPKINKIEENSTPIDTVVGINSANENKYHGPCPPSGTHRYFFKIFALNSKINLNFNTNKDKLEKTIKNYIIEQAELIGLFSHK